jgi:glyoxylase-like metal-dependent hydrolase (beta-lactamase superfamily II)
LEFRKINEHCYYFHSAVNIGYVQDGENGLLIDAGLDEQAAKKVLRTLESEEKPLTHLFITHAHADHYGGASYLQKKVNPYTFAPKFEEAILRNPMLEPMYLFQGNHPVKELRNKFFEGTAIQVDKVVEEGEQKLGPFFVHLHHLPGHSEYQLGVKFDQVLYAADSYFGEEQLHKHKIPFLTDSGKTIESLEKLLGLECAGAVPGHGVYEEQFRKTVQANIDYHRRVLSSLETILHQKEHVTHEEIVQKMCQQWDVKTPHVSSWALFRTAVTAYVVQLVNEQKAELFIDEHVLKIRPI